MSRRLILLLALPGALLAQAASAQAACLRTPRGPLLDAKLRRHEPIRNVGALPGGGYERTRTVVTTSVWVCNRRTGRATVVGRGRFTKEVRGGSRVVHSGGREIMAVSAAGHYVAWAEFAANGGAANRSALVLRLAAFPAARVVRRRVVWSGSDRSPFYSRFAVNRWQDLVWEQAGGVWLWRAGRPPRRLGDGGGPTLHDDGRTVMWDRGARTIDLRPPRQRDGCPVRQGFATVASTGQALVTRARLRFYELDDLVVWRTCWRAEHRDRVVFVGEDASRFEFGDPWLRDKAVGYSEPWLLLGTDVRGKYSWHDGKLRLIDVLTGATTLLADGWEIELGAALLADGSVAWVGVASRSPWALGLWLARPGAAPVVIDTASALTALAAHGTTLSWLHDGQPRAYVAGGA